MFKHHHKYHMYDVNATILNPSYKRAYSSACTWIINKYLVKFSNNSVNSKNTKLLASTTIK